MDTRGATSEPPSADVPTLRRALAGEPLSDAEVLFLHESLLASKTEYTERGLLTFVEWSLFATVKRSGTSFELFVAGPKVNAEWELTVGASGTVKKGNVYRLE